jgi:hypothetical protein
MSEPRKRDEKKPEQKSEPKTEVPDVSHHYKAQKEALKQSSTSENDALGAAAQSVS